MKRKKGRRGPPHHTMKLLDFYDSQRRSCDPAVYEKAKQVVERMSAVHRFLLAVIDSGSWCTTKVDIELRRKFGPLESTVQQLVAESLAIFRYSMCRPLVDDIVIERNFIEFLKEKIVRPLVDPRFN